MTYPNLLQNVGTIDWHVAVTMPENAIPRYFVDSAGIPVLNPRYRGEAFLVTEAGGSAASVPGQGPDSPGYVTDCDFHPNSIAVRLTMRRPGILVINQNYHSAWRSDRGELFEKDGLLAVRLHETGEHAVNLRYLPRSFVVGLIIMPSLSNPAASSAFAFAVASSSTKHCTFSSRSGRAASSDGA